MAKISIELRSGTARFAVAVQAPTLQQALDIAATRFPGNAFRVKSPIDREGVLVGGSRRLSGTGSGLLL
jgi:hypothetical protein